MEMMNQQPTAYMKTARVSKPPLPVSNTPGLYRLHLDDYVRDGAEVYDGEQRIPDVEIRKLCMKKTEKYADVYVPEKASTAFESANWKQMTLRTDMRFLIERMRDFYHKHKLLFYPPPPDSMPENGAFSLEHPLSEQQQQAVDACAFQSGYLCLGCAGYRKNAGCSGDLPDALYCRKTSGSSPCTDE